MRRRGRILTVVAAVALTGACSAGAVTHRPAAAPSSRPPAPTRPPATVPPADPQPGWTPVSRDAAGVIVDERSFLPSTGHPVVVFRFRAPLARFVLHAGSQDPPPAEAAGLAAGPAVVGAERRVLVAAFTGGFHLSDGVGGYEQEGRVVSRLRDGVASLVIDRDGRARVGVWGAGVPVPGERVYSVLQNLPPLLAGGRPSPNLGVLRAWGPTLGGVRAVARCALGEDAAGNLLFAAGMSTLPSDLAAALRESGARTAMELDINPEWVQLAYASAPGGTLVAGVPDQHRPADQYLVGWTRDFVSVVAARTG